MKPMHFDPDAVTAYTAAAAAVSAQLATAADHSERAAAADQSGLGALGTDFARAWSEAVGSQAATVRTAATLVDAYSTVLVDYAASLTTTDADTAAALTAAAEQTAERV